MTNSLKPAMTILHVDMDAYFASIAQLDRPELRGQPVIVGGHSVSRGVVSSASYQARAFGVRSAMPLYKALRLCPKAILVPVDMARYRAVTGQLKAIWATYAPIVEVASLDEAYLDLTGCEALLGPAPDSAARLQAAVRSATGLSCSVGVGSSKLIAKLASERNKPQGLCVVPAGTEREWLASLPIGAVPGIGPKTAARLQAYGIHQVGDIHAIGDGELARRFGDFGAELCRLAHGIDGRSVSAEHTVKSIGAERTFDVDIADAGQLRAVGLDLVQEVAFRLRRQALLARTVTIKLRYADFETVTRARTLSQATDDDQVFAATLTELLQSHRPPGRPVRLLGVTVSRLGPYAQLSLFDAPEQSSRQALNRTLDEVRARFGPRSVTRASHLATRS